MRITLADLVFEGLWAGFGQIRSGAATGLVGSFDDIAAWLDEYAVAGISVFESASNPHLEEAYRIGEQLLPRVKAKIALREEKKSA